MDLSFIIIYIVMGAICGIVAGRYLGRPIDVFDRFCQGYIILAVAVFWPVVIALVGLSYLSNRR